MDFLVNYPVLCSLDDLVTRVVLCTVAVVQLMLSLMFDAVVVHAEVCFATRKTAGESRFCVCC
jgi:hypothetical protein